MAVTCAACRAGHASSDNSTDSPSGSAQLGLTVGPAAELGLSLNPAPEEPAEREAAEAASAHEPRVGLSCSMKLGVAAAAGSGVAAAAGSGGAPAPTAPHLTAAPAVLNLRAAFALTAARRKCVGWEGAARSL